MLPSARKDSTVAQCTGRLGLRDMSDSGYGGGHFGIWYSNPAMGECKGVGTNQRSTV